MAWSTSRYWHPGASITGRSDAGDEPLDWRRTRGTARPAPGRPTATPRSKRNPSELNRSPQWPRHEPRTDAVDLPAKSLRSAIDQFRSFWHEGTTKLMEFFSLFDDQQPVPIADACTEECRPAKLRADADSQSPRVGVG